MATGLKSFKLKEALTRTKLLWEKTYNTSFEDPGSSFTGFSAAFQYGIVMPFAAEFRAPKMAQYGEISVLTGGIYLSSHRMSDTRWISTIC
jgi:hypothetical protein